MNGQIRDHGKILIQVYQTGLNAILCADCDSSCNREGTVKPGGAKHAAVTLHVQFCIFAVGVHLGIFLDLEARGIRMAADQLETVEILLRHRKSDDGGIISRDKIFSARNDLPLLTLQKFAVTGVLKHFSEIFYRLKTGGAVIQELDELLIY